VKRAILAFVGTVAGLVILLGYKTAPAHHGSRPAALAPVPPQRTQGSRGADPSPSAPRRSSVAPTHSSTSVNKTVTGRVIQTQYGPVQVRAVISNGKPTEVTALQLPNDNSHSQQISNYAAPLLRQEALKAGSAHIDIVSGATYTSDGYAQSLQSALNAHG
jgi:uncharacterized protein with FMN-binding domain